MAYASSSDVGAITRNLLGAETAFSTTTCPTLAQVDAWLSSGCALINSILKSQGYTGAIPTSSDAYELATQANALYGAWLAELSRTGARVSATERTRASLIRKDFDTMMKDMMGLDFSQLGVTQTQRSYAGGISESDKSLDESDTDRVKPRFKRDDLSNPDAWGGSAS